MTDWMKLVQNQEVETLVELAKECEVGDPFDWSTVAIDEDEAYRLMATHVLGMSNDPMILAATITKLLVENMVLNTRLIQNGKG